MNTSISGQDEWVKRWSSWDYHFERIRTHEEMTDADKAEILAGFKALREIMGEEWLGQAVRSRHPLYHRLMNFIPLSQLSVARVGLQLKALKSIPNVDRLRRRLMSRDEYGSAEAELEVASCYREAGFVVELYPPVDGKEADLLIKVDGKEFFVEVSIVADSEDARKASRALHDLTWPFFRERDVQMSGRIYKTLSVPHIRELKTRIAEAIERARNTKECQEVTEPGVIQLFIAPRERIEDLKKWQKETDISGLEGPPINVDEVRRLRKRLEEKNRQLPEKKPGVIVVYAHSLTRQFFEPDFYPHLIYELEETVYEHENLIFGAVIASGSDLLPQIVIKDGNYVLGHRQSHVPSMSQDVLIIKNRFSKFPIDEDVVHALLGTSFPHHRSDKSQQHTHDQ